MAVLVREHPQSSGFPLVSQIIAWAFQGDAILHLLEKLLQSRNRFWVCGLQVLLRWHCWCLIFCCLPAWPVPPGIVIWLRALGPAVRLVAERLNWFSWLPPSGW